MFVTPCQHLRFKLIVFCFIEGFLLLCFIPPHSVSVWIMDFWVCSFGITLLFVGLFFNLTFADLCLWGFFLHSAFLINMLTWPTLPVVSAFGSKTTICFLFMCLIAFLPSLLSSNCQENIWVWTAATNGIYWNLLTKFSCQLLNNIPICCKLRQAHTREPFMNKATTSGKCFSSLFYFITAGTLYS